MRRLSRCRLLLLGVRTGLPSQPHTSYAEQEREAPQAREAVRGVRAGGRLGWRGVKRERKGRQAHACRLLLAKME